MDPRAGAGWQLDLPAEERESVDAALRQIALPDSEIEAVERLIGAEALEWPEIERLMTVPGVNVIVAATFMAVVDEIDRFPSPRKLTGYLGLDPRVSQSGSAPATHGRISKQGSVAPRHALVEAAGRRSSSRGRCTPSTRGPAPARPQRRDRRLRAQARCLFWCLLTRDQDYAYQQPSLTAKKLRLLEIRAGAKTHKGIYTGTFVSRQWMRAAERELATQAESAYERMVADWQRTQPKRAKGAGATPGRASRGPSSGQGANSAETDPEGLDFHASSEATVRQRRPRRPLVGFAVVRRRSLSTPCAPLVASHEPGWAHRAKNLVNSGLTYDINCVANVDAY